MTKRLAAGLLLVASVAGAAMTEEQLQILTQALEAQRQIDESGGSCQASRWYVDLLVVAPAARKAKLQAAVTAYRTRLQAAKAAVPTAAQNRTDAITQELGELGKAEGQIP